MSCKYFELRRNLRHRCTVLVFALSFVFLWVAGADSVQANDPPKPAKPAANAKSKATAETDDGEAGTKAATAGTQRDPFLVPTKIIRPPKPVKLAVKNLEPQPLPPPNIEARVTDYKKLLRDYLEGHGSEPSKTGPYLIDELTITGIFRNEEGYGAFVVESATQKQQVFFVRTGWQTYDGQIKEILPTGVKFVKKTRLDNGTVRQTEEFRALPVPTAK